MVYPTSSVGNVAIVQKINNQFPGFFSYGLQFNNGIPNGQIRSAGGTQYTVTGVTAALNAWHHLALVWDQVTVKLYQDGVLQASIAGPTGISQAGTFVAGASYNGGSYEAFFTGRIAEIGL